MIIEKEIEFAHTVISSIVDVPTHVDTYGAGGYICVNFYAELLDIPTEIIKNGTIAHVYDEGTYYQYTNGKWSPYTFLFYGADELIDGEIFKDNTIHGDKLINECIYTDLLSANSITNREIALNSILSDTIERDAISASHFKHGSVENGSFAYKSILSGNLDIDALNGEKIKNESLDADNLTNESIQSSKFEESLFYGNDYWEDTATVPFKSEGTIPLTPLGVPRRKCLVSFQVKGWFRVRSGYNDIGPAKIYFGEEWGVGTSEAVASRMSHSDSTSNKVYSCLAITDDAGNLHSKINNRYLADSRYSKLYLKVLWYYQLAD